MSKSSGAVRRSRVAALGCALTLSLTASHAFSQVLGQGWPGMQPAERNPAGQPTDFKYPILGPGNVWHLTICAGTKPPADLKLPAPKGAVSYDKNSLQPNPAGGAHGSAIWDTTGRQNPDIDIEGLAAGVTNMGITYTDGTGAARRVTIRVTVIDCTNANLNGRGVRQALPRLWDGEGFLNGPSAGSEQQGRQPFRPTTQPIFGLQQSLDPQVRTNTETVARGVQQGGQPLVREPPIPLRPQPSTEPVRPSSWDVRLENDTTSSSGWGGTAR